MHAFVYSDLWLRYISGIDTWMLQGISGAFRPETLTALMGVTGGHETASWQVHGSGLAKWGCNMAAVATLLLHADGS